MPSGDDGDNGGSGGGNGGGEDESADFKFISTLSLSLHSHCGNLMITVRNRRRLLYKSVLMHLHLWKK